MAGLDARSLAVVDDVFNTLREGLKVYTTAPQGSIEGSRRKLQVLLNSSTSKERLGAWVQFCLSRSEGGKVTCTTGRRGGVAFTMITFRPKL